MKVIGNKIPFDKEDQEEIYQYVKKRLLEDMLYLPIVDLYSTQCEPQKKHDKK